MIQKKITTVFLLGQYGAGKDTHGPFIANAFDLVHMSFSGLLTQDIYAKHYIQRGQLVPDEDVFRILSEHSFQGVLFNGFPRTIKQLNYIIDHCKIDAVAMVYLDVVDEVAIHRMENRVICSICGTATSLLKGHAIGGPCKISGCPGTLIKRPDDTPEGIVKRTASFREKTLPIVNEAEKTGMKIYRIKIIQEQPVEITQNMIRQSLCASVSCS